MTTTQNTSTNQNTIHKNRLAILQQLRDIDDQIAYIRNSMNPVSDLYEYDAETFMGHQATNMMTRVMELGSLIATNRALIIASKS
jgi:hypothetical protein